MKDKRVKLWILIAFLLTCTTVGYAAVPQSTVRTTGGGITTYVGHYGNFTLGLMQGTETRIGAGGEGYFESLNTGFGDYELRAMNQDLETTDDVTFNSTTITSGMINDGHSWYNTTEHFGYDYGTADFIIKKVGSTYYAVNTTSKEVTSNNNYISLLDSIEKENITIYIKSGVYNSDSLFNITSDHFTLLTKEKVIWQPTSKGGESFLISIYKDTENVEINGFIFAPNLPTNDQYSSIISGVNYTKNIKIFNCNFTARIYSGSQTPDNSSDSSFVRAIASSADSVSWDVSHNYIRGAGIEAISITNRSPDDNDEGPRKCIVSNNYIEYCRMGVAIEKGAEFVDCHSNIITNIEDDAGILIRHEGTKDNIIHDNFIVDIDNNAINIDGSHRNSIFDNYIYNTTGTGIRISTPSSFNIILDNTIYKTENGVYSDGGLMNEITGNTIKYCTATGIRIETPQKIEKNTIQYCQSNGIQLADGSEGTIIKNNVIADCSTRGIYILCNSTGSITVIENNELYNDDGGTTTIDGNYPAGTTSFSVADATEFEIGQFIRTSPSGYTNENHIILHINYVENELTVESGFANDHSDGDNIITRSVMTHGVDEAASVDYSLIRFNHIHSVGTAIDITGSNSVVKYNHGYSTETFGVEEVYNTNTTATITHGLAGTPTSISITPTWDASAYISASDATTFTVTFTDPTATKDLYWEAYYQP